MLRLITVVAAFVALMPRVASMQGLPVQPAPPEMTAPPATLATEAAQDTPRAPTARPVPPPVDTQAAPQSPRVPQAPRTAQGPPPPATTPPPSTTPVPMPQPPRKLRGRDLNVQIELTISDQLANAAPEKRVVSMLIADGAFGRIRSGTDDRVAVLNIDARPEILENDRLLVELTVEYRPLPGDGAVPARRPAPLNEQLTVILQNGKPLLVSQAADPTADRKMTVEVRASVIK